MTDWKSESIDKLCAALAAAQGSFDTIGRDRAVKTPQYTFHYAPLDVILNAVRPALAQNGLAVSQMVAGEWLRTALLHSSGQWIASEMALGARPAKMQELGSMLTYMRRYALVAMLGVASEEDDDGNTHEGNDWQARDRQPTYQTKAPARSQVDPHPTQFAAPADGMPADLRVVLDAIEASKDLIQLAAAASLGSKLDVSIKGEAIKAYKAKQAKLEGK